ncbi:hypothetical protein [Burkholderia contaminans]|uniref:hypothetical protein n=1 Tax=Burkholderia contaminans TaxID=488447 RepID=UPI003D67FC9E
MQPINATATAQPSVRSPLTANKTVHGITPGSGQGSPLNNRAAPRSETLASFNPTAEKLAKVSGTMRGLESSLDRAIVNAKDFRWNGPRVSDAMSEYLAGSNASETPGVDTAEELEKKQQIDNEINKADMTKQALQSADPKNPNIDVLLAEAERIIVALKQLTQGHEAEDEESRIAAAQQQEHDIEAATGNSGGSYYNPVRETAYSDRPEANFSGGIEGPNGKHAFGHVSSAQDGMTQAYADFINGRGVQQPRGESDAERIARTQAAYQRMNPNA